MDKKKYQLSFQLSAPPSKNKKAGQQQEQVHEQKRGQVHEKQEHEHEKEKPFYEHQKPVPEQEESLKLGSGSGQQLQQWDFQDSEPFVIGEVYEDRGVDDRWKRKDELISSRDRTYSYSYRPPKSSMKPPGEGFLQKDRDKSSVYMEERQASYRMTKRKGWMPGFKKSTRLFLIASSAIIVGLILGVAVLNIFSNLAEEPNQGEASPIGASSPTLQERLAAQGNHDAQVQSPIQPSKGTGALEQSAPLTTQVGDGEFQLPSRTYYFVQAGAFSKSQAAQAMLQEYNNQGYPGYIMGQENPFYLFVGVSGTKLGAQRLSQYYESQGLESYVKEQLLPQVSFSSNGQETKWELLTSLLVKGDQLLTLLSEFASQGLETTQFEITAEEWKSLQELHKDYLQTEKGIWADWLGEEKRTGEEMNKQLSTAVNALETYRQQKHRSFLWQSQQALLNYIHAYHELIQTKIG